MDKQNIIKASNLLLESRLNKTLIKSLPNKCIPSNINEAYLIQNELKKLYLNLNNNQIIGKKVGCTNLEAQKQLNIETPFYGNLFSNFSNDNGCILKSKDFTNPYFEPEFSFRINQDIDISKAPFNLEQIKKFIKSTIVSIEIVDFRFQGEINKIGIFNIIASNGGSEYWIKGKKETDIKDINLENHKVEVNVNDKIIYKGNSSNVLGNPIKSLLWIINHLSEKNEAILNNYLISTGTCTPAVKLNKNDKISVNFENIEIIKFEYI